MLLTISLSSAAQCNTSIIAVQWVNSINRNKVGFPLIAETVARVVEESIHTRQCQHLVEVLQGIYHLVVLEIDQ